MVPQEVPAYDPSGRVSGGRGGHPEAKSPGCRRPALPSSESRHNRAALALSGELDLEPLPQPGRVEFGAHHPLARVGHHIRELQQP